MLISQTEKVLGTKSDFYSVFKLLENAAIAGAFRLCTMILH